MEDDGGKVLRNKGLKERMMRGWWECTEGSGTMEELGKWDGRGKEWRGGRGGIGEVNLGMTASDDELRPRC